MRITLKDVPYEEFRRFFLAKEKAETEVAGIYTTYHNNKNPIMMNNHESKEYAEVQAKLDVARRRTYNFQGMVLTNVYVSSLKVTDDGSFQTVEEHVVPRSVTLEIEYFV